MVLTEPIPNPRVMMAKALNAFSRLRMRSARLIPMNIQDNRWRWAFVVGHNFVRGLPRLDRAHGGDPHAGALHWPRVDFRAQIRWHSPAGFSSGTGRSPVVAQPAATE